MLHWNGLKKKKRSYWMTVAPLALERAIASFMERQYSEYHI